MMELPPSKGGVAADVSEAWLRGVVPIGKVPAAAMPSTRVPVSACAKGLAWLRAEVSAFLVVLALAVSVSW
jgi:hypothetical protein